jgi:hypothetical protein
LNYWRAYVVMRKEINGGKRTGARSVTPKPSNAYQL